jgi:transcriptional regulator with PAS, ATPase and Fis domain
MRDPSQKKAARTRFRYNEAGAGGIAPAPVPRRPAAGRHPTIPLEEADMGDSSPTKKGGRVLRVGDSLLTGLEYLVREQALHAAVLDGDRRPVGLFHLFDFLKRLGGDAEIDLNAPIDGFMEHDPVIVTVGAALPPTDRPGAAPAVEVDFRGRFQALRYLDLPDGEDLPEHVLERSFLQIARRNAKKSIYMVAMTDADGVIIFTNDRLRRFAGKKSLEGMNIREIFPFVNLSRVVLKGLAKVETVQDKSLATLGFPLLTDDTIKYIAFVFQDVGRLIEQSDAMMAANDSIDLMRTILDLSVEGLQVVNKDGIITFVNRSFEEIHNIPASEAVGRHVTEVIENTRMHIVARTGVPELDEIQRIGKRRFVVSRIPIKRKGQCVGALGKIVFRHLDQVDLLARKVENLKKQVEFYRQKQGAPPETLFTFDDIVARAPASEKAKETAMRAAPTDTTVLLLGESGVGKEVYAHSIHHLSLRCRGPFIRVNCSAIQNDLFESELFGYEEGAFTGAKKGGKQGKFEQANFGTIFLDEITEVPLDIQSKLLRVLQEQEIEKIGQESLKRVDVRIIAATNQDIQKLVEQGKFRKDLFYRLNVIPILIPPLRERREDILELVRILWDQLAKKHGIYHKSLGPDALQVMEEYDWPGNIREMRNVLERSLTIILQDTITAEQIQMIMVGSRETVTECMKNEECRLDALVESTERRAISFALARCNNNRMQAAKILGVSRALLYKKMHQYGMI